MLQVETVDQWKNPQDRDLMKPILVTSPWWGPKIPLLYSPQTPHGSVCFQVRESRSQLCTWADTRRHRWARGKILQPHTSCSCQEDVGGTDLMEQLCANEQPKILCVLPSSFPGLCVNAPWGALTGSMLHCLLDKLVWDCKLFSWSKYFSWCVYWVFLSACFYILALKCNELTKSLNLATSYA